MTRNIQASEFLHSPSLAGWPAAPLDWVARRKNPAGCRCVGSLRVRLTRTPAPGAAPGCRHSIRPPLPYPGGRQPSAARKAGPRSDSETPRLRRGPGPGATRRLQDILIMRWPCPEAEKGRGWTSRCVLKKNIFRKSSDLKCTMRTQCVLKISLQRAFR